MYGSLCNDEKIVEKILKFSVELPKQTSNFHKHVLHLINKYFDYKKMIFFPYHTRFYSSIGKQKEDVFLKYVTLNLSHEAIAAYGKHIRHIDIFAPSRLPPDLRDKKVLFTEDIMDKDEYLSSEYYERMHALDVERQACMLLKVREETVATIVIFRSEKEMAFNQNDYHLLEYLSDLISKQYVLVRAISNENVVKTGFEMFFKGSQVGAVIVNHRMTVILANDSAQECCKHFLDTFRNEGGYFLSNNWQNNKKYEKLQEMIDCVGLDLINNVTGKDFTSVYQEYSFSCSPFLFIDTSGDVEIYHLILINYKKKQANAYTEKNLEQLTLREKEILGFIMKGMNNKQIARQAHISVYTVRTHISNIYQKFGVNSKTELLLLVKND